ncbi:uncharacterized protein LOC120325921 [Styela clava]
MKIMDGSENDGSDSKVEKQSAKISNLQSKVENQSNEIKQLKEDLAKVQDMNNKLTEDNENMKKAITRIEHKIAASETPQRVPNKFRQITRPTTTLKPNSENCKLQVGNTCYFAVIFVKDDVYYGKALDICKKRNASVGLTRDEESYNAIVNYLRKNIPKGRTWILIWTGIHIDPMTRDVTPTDSFTKWSPGYPSAGIDNEDYTNVYLAVDFNPNNRYQGIRNGVPTRQSNGVLCEILI